MEVLQQIRGYDGIRYDGIRAMSYYPCYIPPILSLELLPSWGELDVFLGHTEDDSLSQKTSA